MPATHMETPAGPIAFRPEQQKVHAAMTDREVADKAFNSSPGFIEPEAFAELIHRDLAERGMRREDIYERIAQRELSQALNSDEDLSCGPQHGQFCSCGVCQSYRN